MAKKSRAVTVTPSQTLAAQLVERLQTERGESPSISVRKVAAAGRQKGIRLPDDRTVTTTTAEAYDHVEKTLDKVADYKLIKKDDHVLLEVDVDDDGPEAKISGYLTVKSGLKGGLKSVKGLRSKDAVSR